VDYKNPVWDWVGLEEERKRRQEKTRQDKKTRREKRKQDKRR
jgi:hypothetical protein